ncbi:MAG: hypothetical protein KAS21_03445 [Candidatus Aminicenantes bacterium]|nr:hypothetical protein [Candidatus Aminicenantes bacterium]
MKKLIIFSIIAIFVSVSAFADYPQPEQTVAKYYDNAKVIKVKYSQGDTYVTRSFDEGREEAGINIPIFEKDIAGTNDGRLDIYLGRSNFLRLDYDTEVEFQKVPQLRKTDLRIFVRRGGIYLDLHNLDYEKDVEIQTPDCGIFILNRGVYRINYNGTRGTEVFVYEGLAEIAGENLSRNVMENQKVVMRDGSVLERPFFFYSSEKDNFDLWNAERHSLVNYARSSSSRYLDRGYEDYEYELSRSGRWRYSSTYGSNIWIPYNVGNNWRPYYNGRWVHTPHYGYYWYSYDPWNSFTYHYGRWHYDPFWGWHWLPGYRWSPAWVGWCYSGSYYGWTPLSRYNRPVIVINKRWLRNYKYRNGIPWGSQSSVFIKKGNLGRSIRKVALKQGSFINMKNKGLAYRGVSPSGKYNYKQVNVLNSKGRTVRFKESGIKSSTYYKPSKYKSSGTSQKGAVYKYKSSKSTRSNTFKYSGSKNTKSAKGISSKSYKSSGKSSSRVKKSSSSSTRSKVKKKKNSGYPSFSSRGYSGSQSSGNSTYSSSKSSRGLSKVSGYGSRNTSSSRYTDKRYYSSSKGTSSYKNKSYTSGNSYTYSKPKYSSSKSSSYKSYRSYTPRTSTYKKKSYSLGNSYSSYKSYTPRSSTYNKKSYNYGSGNSKSYKNYSKSSKSYSKSYSRSGSSKSYSKGSSSKSYSRSSSSSSSRSSSSSSRSSSRSVRKK